MGAPYSLDLRERVVAAVGSGMSWRAAAKAGLPGRRCDGDPLDRPCWAGPAARRRCRWAARSRSGWPCAGRLDPRPVGGRVGYYRTRTAGRTARAQGRGRLLRCVAFPRSRRPQAIKKTPHASEQDRHDVARRREQWQRLQGKVDAKRLIFVDETWAKTNMTRLHGRRLLGQRLVAKVAHGHWKTLTFVAGLRCDGTAAPCVFDQPINAVSFLAQWVIQVPWCRRCGAATSSSWTISPATRAPPCGGRSERPARC